MPDHTAFLDTLRTWMEAAMHRSMHAFIHYARKSSLSLSQINTLFRLYHHGPGSVNELADHLGITMAAVSQLLASLEESDLIQRSEDPTDRRVKWIALTETGSLKVQESLQARHAWLDDLDAIMPEHEKEAILPALMLLNQYSHQIQVKPHEHHTHSAGENVKVPSS